MRDHAYYVYILTNARLNVMYVGVTNDLRRRLWEHQNKTLSGFTSRYKVSRLVYYEYYTDVHAAIAREKMIKGWVRAKKNALVESINPAWADLAAQIFDENNLL